MSSRSPISRPESQHATIALTRGVIPDLVSALSTYDGVVRVPAEGTVPLEAAELEQISVLVTSSKIGVTGEVLAQLPNLRALVNFGVGVERLDRALLQARRIDVAHTPDVTADCVADLAVGQLIAVRRRIVEADRFVRAGRWELAAFGTGRRLTGMRVGIVGLGRIGRRVVERLSGFDVEVRYHNRRQSVDSELPYEASLPELARWADALIITVPGETQTRHLVDAGVLAALGEGVLVNVSRGSVVDEEALVRMLRSGTLGGAALDVFVDEPRVPDELVALDNVVLTPHIGSATEETRADMVRLVVANVSTFLSTGALVTPAW